MFGFALKRILYGIRSMRFRHPLIPILLGKTDMDAVLESRCANCAAFNQTSQMLDCIAKGIGSEGTDDPYDSILAGNLGYCQFLKFKCAAQRVCTAWVSGGPITDDQMKTHGDMI